jgi:hypothetical protein
MDRRSASVNVTASATSTAAVATRSEGEERVPFLAATRLRTPTASFLGRHPGGYPSMVPIGTAGKKSRTAVLAPSWNPYVSREGVADDDAKGTGRGSHRHPDSENRVLVKVGVMDWPVVLIPTDELRNQRRVPVRGFRRYIYAVNELG